MSPLPCFTEFRKQVNQDRSQVHLTPTSMCGERVTWVDTGSGVKYCPGRPVKAGGKSRYSLLSCWDFRNPNHRQGTEVGWSSARGGLFPLGHWKLWGDQRDSTKIPEVLTCRRPCSTGPRQSLPEHSPTNLKYSGLGQDIWALCFGLGLPAFYSVLSGHRRGFPGQFQAIQALDVLN